ncbi:uncharacterized protein NPIL_134931 [Nephila pilipes]|uniref:Uncharacterized protein n=1 Tax=Nephila pilipes TaxID=299642 RepID=A0A8X6TVR6_NEPPI|nr:uncharacterized protein NPIL_134931 [Nephila pilipes]
MACAFPKGDVTELTWELADLSLNPPSVSDEKKIVVVGNKGCGKSSFLRSFLTDGLDQEYDDSEICRKSRLRSITFLELPSSDSCLDIRSRAYPGSLGVLLCFAINDRRSFLDIPKWHREAMRFIPCAEMFLVGCKMDTRVESGPVGREEGKDMSRFVRAIRYYELSSGNEYRVAEI